MPTQASLEIAEIILADFAGPGMLMNQQRLTDGLREAYILDDSFRNARQAAKEIISNHRQGTGKLDNLEDLAQFLDEKFKQE